MRIDCRIPADPTDGNRLGPVGGRIVMETCVGLIMEDGHSFMRQDPLWHPPDAKGGPFGIAQLVEKARKSRLPKRR